MGASEVIGVSSGKNRELVLREGATVHVDYKTTNFADRYGASAADNEKFDVVYDCASGSGAGENYKAAALTCLRTADAEEGREHGQYVAINGPASMWLRKFTIGQKTNEHLFLTDANTKDLNLLSQLVDGGWSDGTRRLNPIVTKVLSLTSQADVVRRLYLIYLKRSWRCAIIAMLIIAMIAIVIKILPVIEAFICPSSCARRTRASGSCAVAGQLGKSSSS